MKDQLQAAKGFLFAKGWFDAVALIGGKNGDRRFYAEMLSNGAYAESNPADTCDDWSQVQQIVHSTYHPDLRNASDVEAKLTPEQFQAAKSVGLHRIADANGFDKETPVAYRKARQGATR